MSFVYEKEDKGKWYGFNNIFYANNDVVVTANTSNASSLKGAQKTTGCVLK